MAEIQRQSTHIKRDHDIVVEELEKKQEAPATIPAVTQHVRVKKSEQNPKQIIPKQEKMKPKKMIDPKPKSTADDHFWRRTIPFFIAIIVLGLVVCINLGLYFTPALSGIAKPLARFFHYPVAVNGRTLISYPKLEKEIKLVKQFYRGDSQLSGGSIPSDEMIRNIAFTKLIKDVVLQADYVKRGISVVPDELEAGFVYMFGAPSSDQNAAYIVQAFDQTPEQFKQTYLKDFLLQAKLSSLLQQDATRIQKKSEHIQAIHSQVVANPSLFPSMAKATNNDATAGVSGDLGYLSPSQIPQTFASVLSLQVNEISDVIETNDGYYVFQLLETIPEKKVSDASYVLHVRQIVVHKDTASSYANELVDSKSIHIFDPHVLWSASCHQAMSSKSGSCSPEFQTSQFSFSNIVDSITNSVPTINSHFSPTEP